MSNTSSVTQVPPTGQGAADWMKGYDWVCASGHALAGYALMLSVAFVSLVVQIVRHADPHRIGIPLAVSGVAFTAAVLVKEFWYDLKYESGETFVTSLVDAVEYLTGLGLASILIYLAMGVL